MYRLLASILVSIYPCVLLQIIQYFCKHLEDSSCRAFFFFFNYCYIGLLFLFFLEKWKIRIIVNAQQIFSYLSLANYPNSGFQNLSKYKKQQKVENSVFQQKTLGNFSWVVKIILLGYTSPYIKLWYSIQQEIIYYPW